MILTEFLLVSFMLTPWSRLAKWAHSKLSHDIWLNRLQTSDTLEMSLLALRCLNISRRVSLGRSINSMTKSITRASTNVLVLWFLEHACCAIHSTKRAGISNKFSFCLQIQITALHQHYTTLQSMMNAKPSFWHCHENVLIKLIEMISHTYSWVSSQLPFTLD